MAQLKWTYGTPYNKSKPEDQPTLKKEPTLKKDPSGVGNNKQLMFDPKETYLFQESKKEDLNSKISERYLVKRNFQNPYFINHNYVQDMEIRNKYLIPKISEISNTSESI